MLRAQSRPGMVDALRGVLQAAQDQCFEPRLLALQGAADRAAVRHKNFRGGGRCRRAQVGGEIGDGEIDFVADRADHGDRARADRARHGFVVERPQVFERAAAAREQERIVAPCGRRGLQRLDDRRRRFFALHRHRYHVDFGEREAARENAQDIAYRRAGGRGDDADAARQFRQRTFLRRIEQTLCGKPRLELLERA